MLAISQTDGRGRGGHHWQANPGDTLTMSGLLHFTKLPEHFSLLPLLVGLSIIEASGPLLIPAAGERLWIKWPNDVLLEQRVADEFQIGKLAGVLIESESGPAGLRVVLGVGLNLQGQIPQVDNQPGEFAPAVLLSAESIRVSGLSELELPDDFVCDTGLSREVLKNFKQGPLPFCKNLIACINRNLGLLYQAELEILHRKLERYFYLQNRYLRLGHQYGRCLGVARDGALLLELADGSLATIYNSPTGIQIIA